MFHWEVRQQLCQLTKMMSNLPCGYLRLPGVWFLSAVADSVVLILNSGMWIYFETSPNSGLVLDVGEGLLSQVVQAAGQDSKCGACHQMPVADLSVALRRGKDDDPWA